MERRAKTAIGLAGAAVILMLASCSSPVSTDKGGRLSFAVSVPDYAALHQAAASRSLDEAAAGRVVDPESTYLNLYATPAGGTEKAIAMKMNIASRLKSSSGAPAVKTAEIALAMDTGSYDSCRFELLDGASNPLTAGTSSAGFSVANGSMATVSMAGIPANPTAISVGESLGPATVAAGKSAYYSFPAVSGTAYLLTLAGTDGTPDLIAFDVGGRPAANGFASCASGATVSRVVTASETGTAYFAVYGYGTAATYSVSAALAPIAAGTFTPKAPAGETLTLTGPPQAGKAGTAVSYSAAYSGTLASEQWYLDGVLQSGATGASFTLNPSALAYGSHSVALTVKDADGTTYSAYRSVNVVARLLMAYVSNYTDASLSIYQINQATGAMTLLRTMNDGHVYYANNLTLDPRGKFLYVSNRGNDSILSYKIDPGSGDLTYVNSQGASHYPMAIAVDPMGYFIYAPTFESSVVNAYSVDSATGTLSSIGSASIGNWSASAAVDPSGQFLYCTSSTNSNVSMFAINQGTGALTALSTPTVSQSGSGTWDIAVAPKGDYAYTASSSSTLTVNALDTASGELTNQDSVGSGNSFIKMHPSGNFAFVYGSNASTIWVHQLDTDTGTASAAASYGTINTPWAADIDPTGRYLYAAEYYSNIAQAFSIDQATGALTSLGSYATGSGPTAISVGYVNN